LAGVENRRKGGSKILGKFLRKLLLTVKYPEKCPFRAYKPGKCEKWLL